MARSVLLESANEPAQSLRVEYERAPGGSWGTVVLLAVAAASLGFGLYVFFFPYTAARDALGRRATDSAEAAGTITIQQLAAPPSAGSAPDEGDKSAGSSPAEIAPTSAPSVFQTRAADLSERLRRELGVVGADVSSRLEQGNEAVVVRLPEGAVFEPGGADLSEAGETTLRLLASVLKTLDEKDAQVLLIAHLDAAPISKEIRDIYPTSWELSAGRANSAVRYLQDEAKVSPSLLLGVAAAQYHREPASPGKRIGARRLDIEIRPRGAS